MKSKDSPRPLDTESITRKLHSIQSSLIECEDLSEMLSWLATLAAADDDTPWSDDEARGRMWRGVAKVHGLIYEGLSNAANSAVDISELIDGHARAKELAETDGAK